ncbi:cytochrome C assembly family protein [Synoicihabitans lomoniglobus]|uniref:Cytochrome c biogenesis protein CcsA n=1 Tax=Synoicihabitans lomoniglobus TaxID=2909285 RepID=A0AAF0CMF7_9BACT|nr:cytochrome c biogenesis protein [Opitutaceae bacterium LMO-M01]WED63216.1 cytochrome c biogenesis protein CcsA [Opitutaceae bacterium LMO-M01]
MQFDDRTWLWIAAACYLIGFAAGTLALLQERKHSRAFMYVIVSAGFTLQTFGLYLRGLEVKGCPLGNTFELFQFTAWSATALYLIVGATFRLSLLGYFTALMSAALTTLSLAIGPWDATRRVNVFGDNPWIEFHAAIALFSYGVFALLALTSGMYLLRHYSLKHKHLNGFFAFLPAIRELDTISRRLLAVGVSLLAASLAVGAMYWLPHTETVNAAKLITTLGVWIAYLVAWLLRRSDKLFGKRLAWTCIVLFIAALISIAPVNSSRHTPEAPAPLRTVQP